MKKRAGVGCRFPGCERRFPHPGVRGRHETATHGMMNGELPLPAEVAPMPKIEEVVNEKEPEKDVKTPVLDLMEQALRDLDIHQDQLTAELERLAKIHAELEEVKRTRSILQNAVDRLIRTPDYETEG